MAVVRNAIIASAVLAAPTPFVTPHLATSQGSHSYRPAEVMYLSQFALAGKAVYDQNCAACHGASLKGGQSGPSLSKAYFPIATNGNRAFHMAVREGHSETAVGAMLPALEFNDLEKLVKFVSEMQRNGRAEG